MPQFLNLIVTLPLFTAGRISSTVKANEARQQQAVAQYLQVIQRSFREVEDALVIHRRAREVRVEQERRVAEASETTRSRRSIRIAKRRSRITVRDPIEAGLKTRLYDWSG